MVPPDEEASDRWSALGLPLQPDCHIWTEPPPIPYVDEDEDDLSGWVVG